MEAPSCELTNATIEKHLQRLSSCRCFFLCRDFHSKNDMIFYDEKVCRQGFQVHLADGRQTFLPISAGNIKKYISLAILKLYLINESLDKPRSVTSPFLN